MTAERRIPPYERRYDERRKRRASVDAERERRALERRGAGDRRTFPWLSLERGNAAVRGFQELYPDLLVSVLKEGRRVTGFKFRATARRDIEKVIHDLKVRPRLQVGGLVLSVSCAEIRHWPDALRYILARP